jgi:hypothetical protein
LGDGLSTDSRRGSVTLGGFAGRIGGLVREEWTAVRRGDWFAARCAFQLVLVVQRV